MLLDTMQKMTSLPGHMFDNHLRIFVALAACLTATLFAPPRCDAQYEVNQWGNFEDGKLPAVSKLVGPNAPKALSVVDLSTVSGMPPEFRSPEATAETGKFALCINARPVPNQKFSETAGIAIGEKLDRDKLGDAGRALYQADFFAPPSGTTPPEVAVLAMEPPQDATGGSTANPTSFYRFGLAAGRVYFSYIEPTTNTARIYHADKGLTDGMPRPGWHRFAIAFEGHDNIRCYVDGRETSFSPIKEGTLRSLSIGAMFAWKASPYDGYIDNLSIQSTGENMVMPVSPYEAGWKFPAGPVSMRKTAIAPKTGAVQQTALAGVTWLEPEAAWAQAQQEKKAFFLYFGAVGVPAVEELNGIMESDPQARAYLQGRACAKVDMNQLRGGTIARNYQVFKAPTLLVISHDAQSTKRVIFHRGEKWEAVAAQLSGVD